MTVEFWFLIGAALVFWMQAGFAMQKGHTEFYRGVAVETDLRPKVQVDIVVSAIPVRDVIETAKKVLYTGHIGDGKFSYMTWKTWLRSVQEKKVTTPFRM